jgi:predicted house-cleaning noncanonical NTP pyrophosphatase (MazG superfamily)
MAEIADIWEVMDAIVSFNGFSRDEIMQIKQKKAEECGAFNMRYILEAG